MANWLITGAGSGLGSALAQAALELGHMVCGTLRNEAARGEFAALAPGRSFGILLDIADENSVRSGIAAAERMLGDIDILVNNAGYVLAGAVEEVSLAQVRAQFEVNVFGTIAVIQAALPHMRHRRRGHIVNITSVGGLTASAGIGIYNGTKFALEGISEALAKEVAPLGIRLTIVAPGAFRTDSAGRSAVHVQGTIDDYEATAGQARRSMARRDGRQPGDPRKAAAAIIQAVLAGQPPLHLLLGPDALRRAGEKLGALQAEIAAWAAVSVCTNFTSEHSETGTRADAARKRI